MAEGSLHCQKGVTIMKEKFSAAGTNALENIENEQGNIAGFWKGFWHGFIAPFAFLLSLVKDDIGIYEAHNAGRRYNLGYILGLMMVFGGNKGMGGKGFGPKIELNTEA
jgi:hypothetical protein